MKEVSIFWLKIPIKVLSKNFTKCHFKYICWSTSKFIHWFFKNISYRWMTICSYRDFMEVHVLKIEYLSIRWVKLIVFSSTTKYITLQEVLVVFLYIKSFFSIFQWILSVDGKWSILNEKLITFFNMSS